MSDLEIKSFKFDQGNSPDSEKPGKLIIASVHDLTVADFANPSLVLERSVPYAAMVRNEFLRLLSSTMPGSEKAVADKEFISSLESVVEHASTLSGWISFLDSRRSEVELPSSAGSILMHLDIINDALGIAKNHDGGFPAVMLPSLKDDVSRLCQRLGEYVEALGEDTHSHNSHIETLDSINPLFLVTSARTSLKQLASALPELLKGNGKSEPVFNELLDTFGKEWKTTSGILLGAISVLNESKANSQSLDSIHDRIRSFFAAVYMEQNGSEAIAEILVKRRIRLLIPGIEKTLGYLKEWEAKLQHEGGNQA